MAASKLCQYVGNIHKQLRNCTGTARKATAKDGASYVNLWAFRLGGAGDVYWCMKPDLKFLDASK